ncbi:MAG: hypothetical protein MR051_00780 [Lentisphaeria bacterium]|nr:hypothetical protein [Lentisphaeria bacterium]
MKAVFALFLLAVLGLSGCHSDHYYHNEAVERARKFLLKNAPELNAEQINFVRFNAPVLLHDQVLGELKPAYERVSMELHQVCITWIIPGKDELYMVFGVSTGRMDDWEPNRVIRHRKLKSLAVLPKVAPECRKYAQDNFFSRMDSDEICVCRFTMPYLLSTNFDPNLDPDGKLGPDALAAARKKAEDLRQYSLVWKFAGRNLVFTGLGKRGFKGWKFTMAGLLSDEELKPFVVSELMTPADYLNPFPEDKEPPGAAEEKK